MRTKIALIFTFCILSASAYLVYTPRELTVPKIPKLASLPSHMGSWYSARDTIFDANTLRVLRPTDYIMRTYVDADKKGSKAPVTLYIGYHDGSPSAGPIHSPKNCLPGGGWEFKSTEEISMSPATNDENIQPIKLIRAVLAKDGHETTFYYWYQVRGEIITSDISMKVAEFLGTLLDKRKDAAFIRISISEPDKAKEVQSIQSFFQNAYPIIKTYLPS